MFFVQTEILNHIGNKRLENIAVASKAFIDLIRMKKKIMAIWYQIYGI